MVTKDGGTGRRYTRVTIDALPDNALLETFYFYLGEDDADKIKHDHNYDGWHTLVHVCHRWRCIVFASPRRLDLKLYCTRQRPLNSKILEIWPALPIVVVAENLKSKEDVSNIIAALRQHSRVCKIHYYQEQFQDSLLEEFAAIDEPFSTLTSLKLFPFGQNVPVLSDSFLGGSAPFLRSLILGGVPYPSIGKLLSSTTNLVRLSLWRIPHSGYISPETIVPHLSTLSKLETLFLGFQHPRSLAHRASRHHPPLARVVLSNLTSLGFRGDIEYLEDIVSQVETPILNQSHFWFFNQIAFNASLFGHFIHRTETFMTIHTACVEFLSGAVVITLSGRGGMENNDREALRLEITCKPLDWQLSAVAQVLNSLLSSLPTLESLEIAVSRKDWQDEIEIIQWREFLHPFTSVTKIILIGEYSVQLVGPTLQELAGGRTTTVLPALQTLFLRAYRWLLPEPVKKSIEQFVAIRQLYGRPVTTHYQDTKK